MTDMIMVNYLISYYFIEKKKLKTIQSHNNAKLSFD